VQGLDNLAKAQALLDGYMQELSPYDLQIALNNAGYSGTNIQPLTAKFEGKGKDPGVYVYKCTWPDDSGESDMLDGRLYVEMKDGFIQTDF
jgi:hypothetical protein